MTTAIKDASDFLYAGGTAIDLIALADSAPSWTPSTAAETPSVGTQASIVLDPSNPLEIARTFRRENYSHPDCSTLLYASGNFYGWDGTRYCELDKQAVRQSLYEFLEHAKREDPDGAFVGLKPGKNLVDNVIDALKATCFTPASPAVWLSNDQNLPPVGEVIVCRNGILHLATAETAKQLYGATPMLFTLNALDYDFVPEAPEPTEWLSFLDQLWPDDREAVELLQEWFGYVLTLDTSLQKMLLIVGPPRAGKGTIASVLTALIGAANACGPTMGSLASHFGLWPLLGKQLAVINDARLSGRTDQAAVVETFLSVSGEGYVTIDRKNVAPVTLRLGARFMLLSNELPRLADSSGALANRFIVLTIEKSFLGKEDTGLEKRLLGELPGILLWAIQGWRRLKARGHFVQPATSRDAIAEMMDLGSPVSAFIRERCRVSPGLTIEPDRLYQAWRSWCTQQGRNEPGTKQTFGRDLRAALPGVSMRRLREGDERHRVYEGVDIDPD